MQQKIQLLLISLLAILFMGCSQFDNYSPQKVIENTLAADKSGLTYYGEIELSGLGVIGTEIVENAVMKEWRDHERARVEILSSDGKETVIVENETGVQTYDADEKIAYEIDLTEEEAIPFDPREQLTNLFSMLHDTHDIETIGEETFLGRPTFHLKATQRPGTKSILGDQEMWIDREHWMVLKLLTTNGSFQMNLSYTKIDFNPAMDESLFQLSIPKDFTVEKIDDGLNEGETILLKDIPNQFQQSVLVLSETEVWTGENVTYSDIQGLNGRVQLAKINYKHNGLPSMTLSIQAVDANEKTEEMKEKILKIMGGVIEEVSIRGHDGLFLNGMDMNLLEWEEGGVTYTIDIIDPALTLEEVLQLTETMEEIK